MNVKQIFGTGTSVNLGALMTGTAVLYSAPFKMDGQDASVQWLWDETTATLAGTVTRQVSNKPNANPANDTDWVEVTYTSPTISGGDGKDFQALTTFRTALWQRFKYVNATGVGRLYAWVCLPESGQ